MPSRASTRVLNFSWNATFPVLVECIREKVEIGKNTIDKLRLSYVDNRVLTDDESGIQIARKSGLIANVVLDALAVDHLVRITTLRGKVYIGWLLLGPGISKEGNVADFAVVPLYSGQRDEQTQRMNRDIDHSPALFDYANLVRSEGEKVDVLAPQRA